MAGGADDGQPRAPSVLQSGGHIKNMTDGVTNTRDMSVNLPKGKLVGAPNRDSDVSGGATASPLSGFLYNCSRQMRHFLSFRNAFH